MATINKAIINAILTKLDETPNIQVYLADSRPDPEPICYGQREDFEPIIIDFNNCEVFVPGLTFFDEYSTWTTNNEAVPEIDYSEVEGTTLDEIQSIIDKWKRKGE